MIPKFSNKHHGNEHITDLVNSNCKVYNLYDATQAEATTSGQVAQKMQNPEKLWVDKYRPRAFFDLLSDEQINREVLRWLKSWDKLVFNYDPRQARARNQKPGKNNGVPEHRILLISGPPGKSHFPSLCLLL